MSLNELTCAPPIKKIADADLRSAAISHLRFEAIHPLRDGNGRVGRYLLARLIETRYKVSCLEFLKGLDNEARWYKRVFEADKRLQFELLTDLIGRITGIPIDQKDFNIERLAQCKFPDLTPLPEGVMVGVLITEYIRQKFRDNGLEKLHL